MCCRVYRLYLSIFPFYFFSVAVLFFSNFRGQLVPIMACQLVPLMASQLVPLMACQLVLLVACHVALIMACQLVLLLACRLVVRTNNSNGIP